MIPAGLLVAADQHILARLHEQRLDLIPQLPGFRNELADGLCVEELAAAHVHGKGHQRAMHGRTLAGLHKLENHHGRQIIHAERAHILQIAGRRRLARTAHARQ